MRMHAARPVGRGRGTWGSTRGRVISLTRLLGADRGESPLSCWQNLKSQTLSAEDRRAGQTATLPETPGLLGACVTWCPRLESPVPQTLTSLCLPEPPTSFPVSAGELPFESKASSKTD